MQHRTRYIVFDGMDGSGKGTQMTLLKKKFGDTVVFTREPGGAPLAEEVRKLLRDNPLAAHSTALFHFLGFWMAREESLVQIIMPMLRSGKHVFSDRGDSATFAFQLFGEEKKNELLEAFTLLRQLVFAKERGRRYPDQYIVFDLPAEVARSRALYGAGRSTNHFDEREIAYYERVREGFRSFERRAAVEFIDALQTPEEIHQDVMGILASMGIEPG